MSAAPSGPSGTSVVAADDTARGDRSRTRLRPEARREQIVAAAARLFERRDPAEVTFEQIGETDESVRALSLILAAWDEGTDSGLAPELMAYAALYTAITDLVALFGEDAVSKLARGLERRIAIGEFTLHRVTQ